MMGWDYGLKDESRGLFLNCQT